MITPDFLKTRPRAAGLRTLIEALLLCLGLVVGTARVCAYPPALPHTLYGMVRDELGNPLTPGATIMLETSSGVKVFGIVSGLIQPGINYQLSVPLDAGLTSEAYRPTALNPRAPFKIRVKIGSVPYLPIEMSRDFAQIGQPGKRTRLDLTLGEDSNGDGLPDAWQRRIHSDLSKVAPDQDADQDGMTNLQEYLAGTYAFDSESGFILNIVRTQDDAPVLEFTAINGRIYTVQGSSDLVTWKPVSFRLMPVATQTPELKSYTASDVRQVQVQVVTPAGESVLPFFRLKLE